MNDAPSFSNAAQALFDAAAAAQNRAHAPYSDFQVGAAIRTPDGSVYAGCNIENKAYPEGWCAETSAISHMIAAGHSEIKEILVISPTEKEATPCGGCRQRIAEFGGPDTVVYLANKSQILRQTSLKALLPDSFDF
jgi:cytidine deaminase